VATEYNKIRLLSHHDAAAGPRRFWVILIITERRIVRRTRRSPDTESGYDWIISCVQLNKGGPPGLGLGGELENHHRKAYSLGPWIWNSPTNIVTNLRVPPQQAHSLTIQALLAFQRLAECCNWVDSIHAMYSTGPEFTSRPGNRLSWKALTARLISSKPL
jgi:hypothetical protein